jgi:hypothetical protein
MEMIIKGQYRDVIIRRGKVLQDRGWKSNTIVPDYGRFLAALMKKDFHRPPVGIEYIAVGSGSRDDVEFRDKVTGYFHWLNDDPAHIGPLTTGNNWVWAKKIEPGEIEYLDDSENMVTDVTNRIRLEVKFLQNEPNDSTLNFQEFAILGIDKNQEGKFVTARMFLVNYVAHGPITKDSSMELSRTIKLEFPID